MYELRLAFFSSPLFRFQFSIVICFSETGSDFDAAEENCPIRAKRRVPLQRHARTPKRQSHLDENGEVINSDET